MKLLIATPLYPPEIGGPAAYAKKIYEEWKNKGIQVSVVRYSALESALPIGLRHLVYFFRLVPRTIGADAVLALDTWSVGIPALFAARLCGVRVALRIGGDFLWESYVGRTSERVKLGDFYKKTDLSLKERLIKKGTRFLLQHTDILIFNSQWLLRLWEQAYGFPEERVVIVDNYVPNEREHTEAIGKRFVAAGREHVLKNLALLRKVFSRVQETYPDIELDTRPLPPDEHLARVKTAYAVVVSSVSEVNPNAVIEAIRFGKPFIAPEDSGSNGQIRAAGAFIDTLSEEAMERALRDLLNPDTYAQAVAQVKSCDFSHSWSQIATEILESITH
jgi:glycosyltransferase involved in cell wall biosynthesis